eukprot:scaffold152634_cov31-Tisochrysis_lutea.AAC.8
MELALIAAASRMPPSRTAWDSGWMASFSSILRRHFLRSRRGFTWRVATSSRSSIVSIDSTPSSAALLVGRVSARRRALCEPTSRHINAVVRIPLRTRLYVFRRATLNVCTLPSRAHALFGRRSPAALSGARHTDETFRRFRCRSI